jgi:hypothetical protein
MEGSISITRSPVVEVGTGSWQAGFNQMGQFLGFIISDLYTKAEYEKWRNKMMTASEKKTIGNNVWWKDEETGMWYPQIDLPADLPIGMRLSFLQQIKVAGRGDLTQLEKEENLIQRYRTLTKEVMEEVISRGQDPGFAPFVRDTILPTLLLANQAPNIEDKVSIMESLLQGLKRFTTSSKITLQDKERGLRIETRTQPVKKTTQTEKEKGAERDKQETITVPFGQSGVIFAPEVFASPLMQKEIERRFHEAVKRGEIVPSWKK